MSGEYGSVGALRKSVGGDRDYGVLYGLRVRDPQSSTLTTTIVGGWARVKSTVLGQKYAEVAVQPASKAFTASKDTYVYLTAAGALGYLEVANGATKPTQATLETTGGTGAQFIAKVVTDGSRIVSGGVTDLRAEASHGDLETLTVPFSLETGEKGAYSFPVPYSGRILYLASTLYKAAAGTDAGTLTLAIGLNNIFTSVTNGVVTIPLSSAIGTVNEATPSALNRFQKDSFIQVTSAKTTAGGKGMLSVIVEKLAK